MAIALRCMLEGIGGFRREVVIKVIRPEHVTNQSFVHMFLDEARLAASISHSNVAQVFEVDQLGNLPYIVMEYVHGPHLGQLLRAVEARHEGGATSHFGHVAWILAGVCRGLQVAHEAGMVHRDVTPQNILVSTDGQSKLIDFGIAKARGRLEQTEEGKLKGKTAFIAPEMLKGEPVTPAADIYAMGVCLYRTLTGVYPYTADDPRATLARILSGDAVPPSQVQPEVPAALERIVMRCLSRDPSDRYASATQLAEALDGFCREGFWASNAEGVKDWVDRVFPLGEGQWRGGGHTPARGLDALAATLSSQLDEETAEIVRQRAPEPRFLGGASGMGMVLVVSAIAIVLLAVLVAGQAERRSPTVEQDSPQALAYLFEAERQLSSGDPQTAGALLERARVLPLTSPDLVARRDALNARVHRALQEVLTADPLAGRPVLRAAPPAPRATPSRRDSPPPSASPAASPESRLPVVTPTPPEEASREEEEPKIAVESEESAVDVEPEEEGVVVGPPAIHDRSVPWMEVEGLDPAAGEGLPVEVNTLEPEEVLEALRAVEQRAVRAGVPEQIVRGVTKEVEAHVLQGHVEGQELVVYPKRTFDVILEATRTGDSPERQAERLLQVQVDAEGDADVR
ncbi:MAG: serine/threonine protein kinase [Myxococcales bacterium]|nr:serine/threonine protein kinase [Myxococcales bacterium]